MLTITISTLISAFNSLTLSPALSALLLKPHGAKPDWLTRVIDGLFGRWLFAPFNRAFSAMANGYTGLIKKLLRFGVIVGLLYVVLLGATGKLFDSVPGGFIPGQDKQYLVAMAQLPDAASLDRTSEVIDEMQALALDTPGVAHTVAFPGLSVNGFVNASNSGIVFATLADFDERQSPELSGQAIAAQLNQKFAGIDEAFVAVFPPPPILGLGTTGGFKLQLQDRGNKGFDELFSAVQTITAKGNADPRLSSVYSSFRIQVPQYDIDLDREQAMIMGVPVERAFETLQVYMGSLYVNDFNRDNGRMIPLGSFVKVTPTTGPDRVMHYNTFVSADINGSPAPGVSSDQAKAAIEEVLAGNLPQGIGYEWTEVTYQQVLAGNTMIYIFPLVVLLVFLVLAAQYESWSLPLAIILIVPMTLLSALAGVWLTGGDNNIFTRIGLIVLVALACKNAILLVEFAREQQHAGQSRLDAVLTACRLRLRPILMTSVAFTAGVVPLVLATGAGSEMRQAMGVAVFSGMIGVTVFGLLLTPLFYVGIRRLVEKREAHQDTDTPDSNAESGRHSH